MERLSFRLASVSGSLFSGVAGLLIPVLSVSRAGLSWLAEYRLESLAPAKAVRLFRSESLRFRRLLSGIAPIGAGGLEKFLNPQGLEPVLSMGFMVAVRFPTTYPFGTGCNPPFAINP